MGAREKEQYSGGVLGLPQTIKAPYVTLLPSLSHLHCTTHRLFQPMLHRTAIEIHLNQPLTLQLGMYRHTYACTKADSHLC